VCEPKNPARGALACVVEAYGMAARKAGPKTLVFVLPFFGSLPTSWLGKRSFAALSEQKRTRQQEEHRPGW